MHGFFKKIFVKGVVDVEFHKIHLLNFCNKKKLYISMKLLFGTFCIPSQRTCIQAWLIRAYSKGGKCEVFLWSIDFDFTGIYFFF